MADYEAVGKVDSMVLSLDVEMAVKKVVMMEELQVVMMARQMAVKLDNKMVDPMVGEWVALKEYLMVLSLVVKSVEKLGR
jgi:hypothetical protein